MKAVIFDLNGTMIYDSAKHEFAWKKCIFESFGIKLSEDEFNKNINGKTNRKIVEYVTSVANIEFSEELLVKTADEKERIYRDLCINDPCFSLAPGLYEFLDYLKSVGASYTIVTSSEEENVDFYFKTLGLSRWFYKDKIIYDKGTMPGKPDPAFYLAAIDMLCRRADDCIVFEDSASGIISARSTGIKTIIGVASAVDPSYLYKMDGIERIIPDYHDYKNLPI